MLSRSGDLILIGSFTLAGAAAQFVAQILLARLLTPVNFGIFNSAMAWAALVVPLAVLGIPNLWQRLAAERGEAAGPYLRAGSVMILVSGLAVAALFALFAIQTGAGLAFALIASLVVVRSLQEGMGGAYQVDQAYRAFSWLQCWPYLGRLVVVLGLLVAYRNMPALDVLTAAGAHALYWLLASALLAFQLLRFGSAKSRSAPSLAIGMEVVRQGSPFMAANLGWAIHSQAAIALSALLFGFREAGWFAAAMTFAAGGALAASVVYQRYFTPRMFRERVSAPVQFADFVEKKWPLAVIFALGMSAALIGCALWLLVPLLGAQFAPARGLLLILAFLPAMQAMSSHFSSALISDRDQRYRMTVTWIALAIELSGLVAAGLAHDVQMFAAATLLYDTIILVAVMPRAFANARAAREDMR